MAPKTPRRRDEAAEIAAFITELYECSGFDSWGQFAREVGISAGEMSDYKRAENVPGGFRLLKMIRAANWPPPASVTPSTNHRPPPLQGELLGALESMVDRLREVADNQTQGVARLARIEERLAKIATELPKPRRERKAG